MPHASSSPYARALGARKTQLDGQTQKYFSTIPEGHVGIGEGVFERVGTPRRWLWPMLRPLDRGGIVVAGWFTDIPFRIENRTVAGHAIAERTLALPGGSWAMRDAVALSPRGRLLDQLGDPAVLAASFDVDVVEGSLRLTSHAVGMRIAGLRVRIPRLVSPTIRLSEGLDTASGTQRISLTVDVPVIGRIYEYSGTFAYRIEEEQ
jgi:hypothetical protein